MTQATKKDIGKWCKFYDEDDLGKCFLIDKLYQVLKDGEYFRTDSFSDVYEYCTPLTEEQIKSLGLEE